MQRQVKMEEDMLRNHRQFVSNLETAVKQLERDVTEAAEMERICTDEWCHSTEMVIDELHKAIYAISEPRWASHEDSQRIVALRNRVKDLYVYFKNATHTA